MNKHGKHNRSRRRRSPSVWLLFAWLPWLVGGCLTSPMDGSVIEAKDSTVQVSGYFPEQYMANPNRSLTLPVYAYNRRDKVWDKFAEVQTRPEDKQAVGSETWHPFTKHVTLPQAGRYWGWAGDDKPRTRIKVGGDSTSNSISLFTFRESDLSCMVDTLSSTGSGYEVINQCSTDNRAYVKVECGGRDQACCRGNTCDDLPESYAYLTCSSGICRRRTISLPGTSTGSSCDEPEGQPCSAHPSECVRTPGITGTGTTKCRNGEIVCELDDSSYCAVCGPGCGACAGAPCSASNLCNPGAECINGTCRDSLDCRPDVGQTGYCWLPGDVGSCSGTGTPVNRCLYDGQWYDSGATFPAIDGCNTCTCDEGRYTCGTNDC